jgi:hypothetical protein
VATEITLDNIYPWGRSFDEYRRMFALTDEELNLKILGCADGPASFNAEMRQRGNAVVSCDPLYKFDRGAIQNRVAATAMEMIRKARENAHRFVWDRIKSPEHMAELRLAATEIFLDDYEIGRAQGRYVDERLPELPFAYGQFDLALCSHFLFLYEDELSLDFHLAAVNEMCRVAKEARIFPLLGMTGEPSHFVEPVMRELGHRDLAVTIEKVDYEFQRGGNQMMRIKSSGAR